MEKLKQGYIIRLEKETGYAQKTVSWEINLYLHDGKYMMDTMLLNRNKDITKRTVKEVSEDIF